MRVLVIGGGSISRFVVRQLVDRGHQVTLYHRGTTEIDLPFGVEHVHSAEASIPILRFPQELLGRSFDTVIHMLAMGQDDAEAAVASFRGRAARLIVASSGDVYRAYGRLTGLEPGPVEPMPLTEESPVRTVLFPYRTAESGPQWMRSYEKILVERVVLSDRELPATILRLPKVYGGGKNDDLTTMYGVRNHPEWRWTHGYVENVAAAIVLAAMHSVAGGRIYNVGEEYTPTVAERLSKLPSAQIAVNSQPLNYDQEMVYDTSRIRSELSYREIVPYEKGLRRSLRNHRAALEEHPA
jgi:nucleoside-diphosphate-sugar epimerase